MTKLETIKSFPSAGANELITLDALNETVDRLQKTAEDLALAIRPIAREMAKLAPMMATMATQIEQINVRLNTIEKLQASKKPSHS